MAADDDVFANDIPAPEDAAPPVLKPPTAPAAAAATGGSPDDVFANDIPAPDTAPDTTTAAPASWGDLGLRALRTTGREAEIFGSGMAHGLVSPADLLVLGANKFPDLANYLAGTNWVPNWNIPYVGSQAVDWAGNKLGVPKPANWAEDLVFGAGAGVGGMAYGGLGGGVARGLLTSAAGGAGATAAGDVVGAMTQDPNLRAAAALAGGGAAGLATGGATAIPGAVRELRNAGSDVAKADMIGRILNESATTATPDSIRQAAAQPQPAGISPSLGDLTLDPGLQRLQRQVEEGATIQQAGQTGAAATANDQAIRDSLTAVGDPAGRSPTDLSTGVMGDFRDIRNNQKLGVRNAWDAVPLEETMVETAPVAQRYGDFVSGLSVTDRRFLPSDYKDTLDEIGDQFGPQAPLREYQDLSSNLTTDARDARAANNNNRARILGDLHDELFPNGVEDLVAGQGGTELATARAATAADKQTYSDKTQPGVGAIATALKPGAADSTALNGILGSSGTGQTERAAAFVRAAQNDPDVLQGARDWFIGNMLRQNTNATGRLSGPGLADFVQKNDGLIKSAIFSDSDRQAITDAVNAANGVGATARSGGPNSQTYRLLQGNQYLQAAGVSPLARHLATTVPRLGGAAAGATVGGYAGSLLPYGKEVGPMLGAYLGEQYVGEPLARALTGNVENARTDVLTNLLPQAMRDPQQAAAAMSRPGAQIRPGAAPSTLGQVLAAVPPASVPRRVLGTLMSPGGSLAQPGRWGLGLGRAFWGAPPLVRRGIGGTIAGSLEGPQWVGPPGTPVAGSAPPPLAFRAPP